ncbi:MarR family transcriptional regulator [Gordonia terrae]
MNELAILRIVSIKGRVAPESITESLGIDAATVSREIESLTEAGYLKGTEAAVRITPEGRERCRALVVDEHDGADASEVAAIYEEFCEFNTELKSLITRWQMRDDETPNDHTDRDYDHDVLTHLHKLHVSVLPLTERIAAVAPRLAHYGRRLKAADEKISLGESIYVARPITDSYHTVWFELHEDLIGLAGLTRAEEASAGRGA